jgi:transketolase
MTRRELANAIRALSMDSVQKAKSGHPGAPMGMADIAEVLWNDFLEHDPGDPAWFDRDRFVLSNGHGSMLLYSMLHLTGYDLPMSELQRFRQLHSKTPGHPEVGVTPGVETTTGPLGQGITNAVGMALAERMLAARFNQPDYPMVDHYTYAFLGDGCLMEGISHEACSLAGTLGLNKLIAFYDDNGISIDGHVQGWFTDDTPKRFEAYGWQVIRNVDGHDAEAVIKAIKKARRSEDKPTLICCKTVIGYGAPNKQGKEECHGAPLGDAEVALARQQLGWPHAPFTVPDEVYEAFDARAKGKRASNKWKRMLKQYHIMHPELAAELERRIAGELPADWAQQVEAFVAACAAGASAGAPLATRKSSENALNAYGPALPELVGGSADLTGSNLTWHKGSKGVTKADPSGNYLWYGVREFAMAGVMNGLALHGGFIPYGGTFLTFSDYMRNAIRMAALMKLRTLFVFTHDSIGLGEDGPTHQAVEHVASLRLIPNLSLWRPCDATETAVAWACAIEHAVGPTAFALTRQNLPQQPRTPEQVAAIRRGGYTLVDCAGSPDLILIGTGSEVALCVEAAKALAADGKRVRVVSLPNVGVFDAQDPSYKESVLPASCTARVAVEAGVTAGWWKHVGPRGRVVGIDSFGESAPAGDLFKHFGFTVDNVVRAARDALAG